MNSCALYRQTGYQSQHQHVCQFVNFQRNCKLFCWDSGLQLKAGQRINPFRFSIHVYGKIGHCQPHLWVPHGLCHVDSKVIQTQTPVTGLSIWTVESSSKSVYLWNLCLHLNKHNRTNEYQQETESHQFSESNRMIISLDTCELAVPCFFNTKFIVIM